MTIRPLIETESQAREYIACFADTQATQRLETFAELLKAENRKQNLISKPSEDQIWQRHFADSAQLIDHVPRETFSSSVPEPWLDLGTGAGFPGLVIAILKPMTKVRLVESRGRRVEFLKACVEALQLEKCEVIGDRLERITPFPCSVISARAFAPLDKLLRLSAPFSTKQTRYVLPKGRSAAHELTQQKKSIRMMFHVEQSLTDRDAGIILSSHRSE